MYTQNLFKRLPNIYGTRTQVKGQSRGCKQNQNMRLLEEFKLIIATPEKEREIEGYIAMVPEHPHNQCA